MFDFFDSDLFVFSFNIIALLFIIYDIKQYQKRHERKYLLNIALTIGFTIWIMIPFYNKYITWDEAHTLKLTENCTENNTSLCSCIDDLISKSYTLDEYIHLDKNSSSFVEFYKDSKEECLD